MVHKQRIRVRSYDTYNIAEKAGKEFRFAGYSVTRPYRFYDKKFGNVWAIKIVG